MDGTIASLLARLGLETLSDDLFQGTSPQGGRRVFGGQVVAQALVAAQRTVDPERPAHSLHGYFMRPGDPARPIAYRVERLRNGGSFSTRRVDAVQAGEVIFSMLAAFQRIEEGLTHQAGMPDVPPPEDLPSGPDLTQRLLAAAPEPVRRYWLRPRPFEFRPVSLDHYLTAERLEPAHQIWIRLTEPTELDPAASRAVLAYLSDLTLLDVSLFAHGTAVYDPRLQVASLDHALWFHRPAVPFDDWLLYAQDSPATSGGRGFSRGSLFTRDGRLVASVAQEGLIRRRRRDGRTPA
ncbi:acyl-CoA thioesterase II [Aurantimonas sp. MSK8Z-1]|uniref:acyl-CoA thioesterase n=1 Tax=Mangrovibrevibacter kandeliae TaxID=2968473 RepID=UPI002119AD42|nr:acyl-CoA thioesterase II [Aurantimonas sp. MSK8Z-1]MCW4115375.1 acyl-CoA thioesterase II [Aurantimonas sp. MSK8Z-1]